MTADRLDTLARRLRLLATKLILDKAPVTDQAAELACDLIVAGSDTPSTVAVAALTRTAPRSDSEIPIRSMLEEQGVELPGFGTEDERYDTLRHAFAYWDLPLADFEGPFCARLPEWGEQAPLDRTLVVLLDRRGHESDPLHRAEIERQMREAIRHADSDSAG